MNIGRQKYRDLKSLNSSHPLLQPAPELSDKSKSMEPESPSAAYAAATEGLDIDDSGAVAEHAQPDGDDEDFEPDPNMETLDLSGQYIDDLEPLIKLVFQKMPKLRELNLSNNMISALPQELCRRYLPMLESINLNGNQIPQDPQPFAEIVESLSLIGHENLSFDGSSLAHGTGGLKVLFISLTREDQVDFILRKLPRLEFLNGLAVDRDELYSSQEVGADDLPQPGSHAVESDDLPQQQQPQHQRDPAAEDIDYEAMEEAVKRGADSDALVEVMQEKHEMFQVGAPGSQEDLFQAQSNRQSDLQEALNENEHSFQGKSSSAFGNQTQQVSGLQNLIDDDDDLANAIPLQKSSRDQ